MSDFIAWLPDAETLDALDILCAALPAALPALPPLRVRARAQFHMTLRYLAEGLPDDPAPLYAALADIAVRTPRMAVRLDRVEVWGGRVVVARAAPSRSLDRLSGALEDAVVACGHAPETREAAPHVTLAYLAAAASGDAPCPSPAAALPLPVDGCLGSLSMARTAPGRYDALQWWPLAEPADVVLHDMGS